MQRRARIASSRSRRFASGLLLFVGVCLLFALSVSCAWADDETTPASSGGDGAASAQENASRSVDSDGNTVNVNQMPDSSFLYNTDISELAGAESFHDTQMVQIYGEVVGDRIHDETDANMCWITLQSLEEDDSSSIAVSMTNDQAALIDRYGNYGTNGTELQVRGIFYLSCPEHQGLSDVHAQEVTVVQTGSDRDHTTNPAVIWAAVLAVGLGLLSLGTYRFLCERRK